MYLRSGSIWLTPVTSSALVNTADLTKCGSHKEQGVY